MKNLYYYILRPSQTTLMPCRDALGDKLGELVRIQIARNINFKLSDIRWKI